MLYVSAGPAREERVGHNWDRTLRFIEPNKTLSKIS